MADIKTVAKELVATETYILRNPYHNMIDWDTHAKYRTPKHKKADVQRKNEIGKRRKKNKNKKTHRR